MATMDLRRCGATTLDFEDTRPALYLGPPTGSQFNAMRWLRGTAAEAPPRPVPAAWPDEVDDSEFVDEAPWPASLLWPPLPVEDAKEPRWLAQLVVPVVLAVGVLGFASVLIGNPL